MQVVVREVGVERGIYCNIVTERYFGQSEFFRHNENRGGGGGEAPAGVYAVEFDAAGIRCEQAGYKIEQCAFAYSVASQQAVNAPFGQLKGKISYRGIVASGIGECQVVYRYHVVVRLGRLEGEHRAMR